MVIRESDIVGKRADLKICTEAILTQAAVSSILSKDGQKHFQDILEKLQRG